MTTQINEAKKYFYNKEFNNALEIFLQENSHYEAGLCFLLLGDEKKAKKCFEINSKNCPASAFGLCILKLIHLEIPKKKPSFFQTRAFLEIYLNLFLENNLLEWAQNLISSCDILYCSNPETYKFIARSLYSNGYFDLAITFCKKTLRQFYSDPEAFLILSQCHYLLKDLGEALDCINRVLNMVDDYYPALLFREILREEIKKKTDKNN